MILHEFGPCNEGMLLRSGQVEFCRIASRFGGSVVVKDDVRPPAVGKNGEQPKSLFRPENLVNAILEDPSSGSGCNWGSQEQIVELLHEVNPTGKVFLPDHVEHTT